VVRNTRFGRIHYYGCAYHACRGDAVCPNHTLLPQAAVERELLELLQREILTPATLERLLIAVNAKLRAQAAAARPRVTEIRRSLGQVEREIANYTRAVARGNFASLESALRAAEQRRTDLQAELARLDGNQQTAVLQLTPAALAQHHQGQTEKLRSGENGKVREAIEQSVARILVGGDGSLTIEAKPGGRLGVEGTHAYSGDTREEGPTIRQAISSADGRQFMVKTAAYG
jgi:hypothetical protein